MQFSWKYHNLATSNNKIINNDIFAEWKWMPQKRRKHL
jgi:hypothetical protein